MADEPGQTSAGESLGEVERLRLLLAVSQEFNSSLDFDELLPQVFNTVLDAVGAQGGSLWLAEGQDLRCHLALGSASEKLIDTTVPIGTGFVGSVVERQRSTIVTKAIEDPRFHESIDRSSQMIATTVMASPMIAKGETVGAIQVTNKVTGIGIFDDNDREILEVLATSAAQALKNAQLHAAEKRARDLALLLEISQDITATLDLDRVLQSVANNAARALPFDRGAIALFHNNRWEVRAVAGQETVDSKTPELKRLADRGAWAADRGEPFFLEDRARPDSDATRAFVTAFAEGLEEDDVASALYLPLKDEEGTLGVLLCEAHEPGFANETHRELAEILANQTTVALRNAYLYHQVPMADTWGALARRRRAFLSLPKRRKQVYAGSTVVVLAALTLIQWPLRVTGAEPTLRAASYAEVRAMVPGVIDQVFMREGMEVPRGAPLAQLRDVDLQAARGARTAEAEVAERSAAIAASRSNPAEERLHRTRAAGLRHEVALLNEEIAATTIRAPTPGAVLTARPEERVGEWVEEGDHVVTVGRLDTLELDFGVAQRDISRVEVGQTVRLRVDALPQHTFEGVVTSIGQLPGRSGSAVLFIVHAKVPNPKGHLKPGMVASAKVLTEPVSMATRLIRGPARWLRLTWWRMRP